MGKWKKNAWVVMDVDKGKANHAPSVMKADLLRSLATNVMEQDWTRR